MTSRVIAIDGPAASGKSTTAKAVAGRLGLSHLDSGALYRCITLAALDEQAPIEGGSLSELADSRQVKLKWDGRAYKPIVGDRDVSRQIREDRVNARVSAVAALPQVREWVNAELRRAAGKHPHGVVVDGRDIGTVVFPDAAVKIFLVASPEERARRRAVDLALPPEAQNGIIEELRVRDEADSSRLHAPLVPHKDAIQIDTTNMAFEEQVKAVVEAARPHFP
ncbi:MAG: (d)CMP kinase [Gemmatimonadales bacterium]